MTKTERKELARLTEAISNLTIQLRSGINGRTLSQHAVCNVLSCIGDSTFMLTKRLKSGMPVQIVKEADLLESLSDEIHELKDKQALLGRKKED